MRGTCAAVLAACLLLASDARAERRTGVVVLARDAPETEVMEALGSSGGVEWRLERILPQRSAPAPLSTERIAVAREAYLEADFPSCFEALRTSGLDVDGAIEAGQVEVAAEVGVLEAACSLGAGERVRARDILRGLLVREVDIDSALERTTVDLRALAAEMRAELAGTERVRLTVRTEPGGAHILFDGGAHECLRTPCSVTLAPGDHVLRAELVGRAPVVRVVTVRSSRELDLQLPVASAEEAREQLARLSASARDLGREEVLETAARAYETELVLLVWEEGARTHAVLYDGREPGRLVRASAGGSDGESGLTLALRQAVTEWATGGRREGPSGGLPAWGWALIGVGAGILVAAAGVLTWLLVAPPEPPERRYDLVFP